MDISNGVERQLEVQLWQLRIMRARDRICARDRIITRDRICSRVQIISRVRSLLLAVTESIR